MTEEAAKSAAKFARKIATQIAKLVQISKISVNCAMRASYSRTTSALRKRNKRLF